MSREVVVVGAGMAGITCARLLARAGMTPLVLDKGRGIGGRMATRRVVLPDGPVQFDHGAQYLTARDPDFAALLERCASEGSAAQWAAAKGNRRWVGMPGMSGLVRGMAAGIEVRQRCEIRALRREKGRWLLEDEDGTSEAVIVVLAIPAPQAHRLIGAEHPLAPTLDAVTMQACLTLMAALPPGTPAPFETETSATHPLAWIARDSAKPGRPEGAITWVAQAAPGWSARFLDDDPEKIASRMLALLSERLGIAGVAPLMATAHRWRLAQAMVPAGVPFLRHGDLYLGGDWCLGSRAEDAWASGRAIAHDILGNTRPGQPAHT
ncbi:MAG: NAD(P)-binding protein [Rhodobacteraceae bacterium]|nr:NAD(P)-binding protein [Paracoccaceae bacterium]